MLRHICLFMSYLYDLFFIFIFIFIMINRTNTDTLVHFWMITWMKNVNNFQIGKVQPQSVAQLLLNFLPILAWLCL